MKLTMAFLTLTLVAQQIVAGEISLRGRPSLAIPPQTSIFTFMRGDLETDGANVGRAIVDHATGKLRVELFDDSCLTMVPSEPGAIHCQAAPSLVRQFEVPLLSTTVGGCGVIIYSGEEDTAIADGARVAISISDARDFGNHCLSIAAVLPTSGRVEYETTTAPTKSLRFEGGALK